MTGNSATVVSTNTTVGFPAISGWSYGRRKRSSRFPSEESVGGLSAADVHDAGCWGGGGQSGERLAGVAASRTAVAVESPTVAQRDGLRATAAAASTLAYRCFLPQPLWDLLLPV